MSVSGRPLVQQWAALLTSLAMEEVSTQIRLSCAWILIDTASCNWGARQDGGNAWAADQSLDIPKPSTYSRHVFAIREGARGHNGEGHNVCGGQSELGL